MASEETSLAVRPRGKPIPRLPSEISIPTSSSASTLYTNLSRVTRLSPHRLRVTKGSDGTPIPNNPSLTLHSTGLRPESVIYIKDLGPQIAWRTVFLVEYLGPLLIHPLLYTFLHSPSNLQTLSLALFILHFGKREVETLFIHRFSAATMPASNIFKNSFHYWVLGGLNIAYWIYQPSSPTSLPSNRYITYPALLLFLIGELGNLYTHIILRNLRGSGTAERRIPHGIAFSLVTCPNYMFEAMAWLGITMVTWSWSTVLFTVVALAQMGSWAWKKERRYRKEFGGKYQKKRFAMLPGIY